MLFVGTAGLIIPEEQFQLTVSRNNIELLTYLVIPAAFILIPVHHYTQKGFSVIYGGSIIILIIEMSGGNILEAKDSITGIIGNYLLLLSIFFIIVSNFISLKLLFLTHFIVEL